MNITLYIFSKRKNSTKRPTGGVTKTCYPVPSMSIITPTVRLNGDMSAYNYAYISDYGRYYYITDCIRVNGDMSEIQLSVDVMATYKTEIAGTSAYIQRASAASVYNLRDPLVIPQNREASTVIHNYTLPDPFKTNPGCYIITIVNNSENVSNAGSTTMYFMSEGELRNFTQGIFNEQLYPFEEYSWAKFAYNPFEYITSCMWFPLDYTKMSGTLEEVQFGWWDSGIQASALQTPGYTMSVHITFDYPYSDFRSFEPYTTAMLYIPGFGVHQVNLIELGNDFYITITIDLLTGAATASIEATSTMNTRIGYYSGVLGFDVPIAQIRRSGQALTGTISAIGSALTGNVPGAIGSVTGAIESGVNPSPTYNAAAGSKYSVFDDGHIHLVLSSKYTSCNPTDLTASVGRPYNAVHAMNLSGYILPENASVSIDGTDTERSELNSIVNGGFYYE